MNDKHSSHDLASMASAVLAGGPCSREMAVSFAASVVAQAEGGSVSEPWPREQQINYAVFHHRYAPPAWWAARAMIAELAKATGFKPQPGATIFTHFNKLLKSYEAASHSVD